MLGKYPSGYGKSHFLLARLHFSHEPGRRDGEVTFTSSVGCPRPAPVIMRSSDYWEPQLSKKQSGDTQPVLVCGNIGTSTIYSM